MIMKKLMITLAAILCCATMFNSCKKADSKQEEKVDDSPAYVLMSFTYVATDDMIKYTDMKVTYLDQDNAEKTETVTSTEWTKVVKFPLPAELKFDRAISWKPDAKNQILEDELYSYIVKTKIQFAVVSASGKEIRSQSTNVGDLGSPTTLKGKKFVLVDWGKLSSTNHYSFDKEGKCPQLDAPKNVE